MQEESGISGKMLTIIIPMYQSELHIKRCLDSMILGEADMRDLEILVVDDGSRDAGTLFVEEYVHLWPDTVRLLKKENGGHGSAVNLGTSVCRGKFFKVVDADDWVLADGVREVIKLLKRDDEQSDVVLTGYQIYDIRSGSTETVSAGLCSKEYQNKQGTAKKIVRTGLDRVMDDWGRYRRLFTLHGLIYRTDFYRSVGLALPEHVYYDDAYFDVVYACKAFRNCVIDSLLYVYRVGDSNQSVSLQNRERRIHELETVLLYICETMEKEKLSESGTSYWYHRTESFLTDYYVTALLRFRDRRKGRVAAHRLSAKIKMCNRRLYRMCRKKYMLLFGMSFLHGDADRLESFLKLRERFRYQAGKKKI